MYEFISSRQWWVSRFFLILPVTQFGENTASAVASFPAQRKRSVSHLIAVALFHSQCGTGQK